MKHKGPAPDAKKPNSHRVRLQPLFGALSKQACTMGVGVPVSGCSLPYFSGSIARSTIAETTKYSLEAHGYSACITCKGAASTGLQRAPLLPSRT